MMMSFAFEAGASFHSSKLGCLLVALERLVDQAVDGGGAVAALAAHHAGGLAGEGREQHLAVDPLGDVLGERGLAGAGIAEQPEDRGARRAAALNHSAAAVSAASWWGVKSGMALIATSQSTPNTERNENDVNLACRCAAHTNKNRTIEAAASAAPKVATR